MNLVKMAPVIIVVRCNKRAIGEENLANSIVRQGGVQVSKTGIQEGFSS